MRTMDDTMSTMTTPPRRSRTLLVVAAVVAAAAAGVGLGLVLARGGDGEHTPPATTAAPATTAPPVTTAPATTVAPATSAPTTAPATTAAPATTSAPEPAPTATAPDGYVALTEDGIELRGAADSLTVAAPLRCKVTLDGSGCTVHADASASGLWWSETIGGRSTLLRVGFEGGAAREVVAVDGDIVDIAVTPDERTVWFAVSDPRTSSLKLQRFRDGKVSTLAERGNDADVSADGRWLAYSIYGDPARADGSSSVVVVVDLRNGATRTIPFAIAPFSIERLEWSPDASRLLVRKSWEGAEVGMIDPATATSDKDVRWIESGPVDGMGCWLDNGTVAVNGWTTPYAEGTPKIGPVVKVDLASGARTDLSSQGAGTSLACRPGAAVFTATFSSEMALSVEPASGAPGGQPEYGYLRVLDI